MKKAAGVLIMVAIMMIGEGCSKEEEKFDLGKETEKIEVQVPTLEPTPTVNKQETEMPVMTTAVPATPVASSNPNNENMESSREPEENTKDQMQDYFTISLPENVTIQYKEEEFTAKIEKQGKRIGEMQLISQYPAKISIEQIVKEQLKEEGYLREVRTYDKGAYCMVKAEVSTGISKEDVEHGKLIGGGEEAHYIYYRNTAPTSLMILSFKEDALEKSQQDSIARTVVLNK